MARIRICKEANCKDAATTTGYCRLHYLKNWKEIHEEKQKKAADRLNKYVEHMCKRNPDGYVEEIRKHIGKGQFDVPDDEPVTQVELKGPWDEVQEEEIKQLIKNLRIEKEF